MDIEQISSSLIIPSRKLTSINISIIDAELLEESRNQATQCYNNAFYNCPVLKTDMLIYGVAITSEFGTQAVEHCWNKLANGQYVDPTYQIQGIAHKTRYYSLLEMDVNDIELMMEEANLACPPDMNFFRRHPNYGRRFQSDK